MNVALLHYSAPPVVGGVERVLAQQARLMSAAGHRVRVIAGSGSSFDRQIHFLPVPIVSSRHTTIVDMKAQLDKGVVPEGFSSVVNQIVSRLEDDLKAVDVLIAHNVCSLHKNLPLTAAIKHLSQQSGAPKIVLWHHDLAWTSGRYQGELHEGFPWDLLRKPWPPVKQVVVSEHRRRELAQLQNIPPEQIEVIPNGLDIARFLKLGTASTAIFDRLQLAASAPLLLLPVRITRRKNIELALETLTELRKKFPQAALIVTGPLGPHNPANRVYFEELKSLQESLGLTACVHFLAEQIDGYIPDEVIADLYRLADALFLPSREEGFGLPILEAGLAGMPIFCSDITSLRELVGEDGLFFSPDDDPNEIAALVARNLKSNAVYRHKLRVRQNFAWPAIYLRHIEPLLAKLK
jgi:glycosyltransferase involved in cell wall biosynthesis